jgi:hypothetical protein
MPGTQQTWGPAAKLMDLGCLLTTCGYAALEMGLVGIDVCNMHKIYTQFQRLGIKNVKFSINFYIVHMLK